MSWLALARKRGPLAVNVARGLRPVVLHESASLLAVNKPERCAVKAEPGTESDRRWTELVGGLRRRYGAVHPVHRLDASVTGVLLFARTSRAGAYVARVSPSLTRSAAELGRQFAHGHVKKSYLALLTRAPTVSDPPSATMHDGLPGHLCSRYVALRTDGRGLEQMQLVDPDAEGALRATMRWRCLEAASDGGLSLVHLEPEHGRRHMLRVLCADALGAGILGDFKYARSRKHARFGLQKSGRICLHASELTFTVRRMALSKS